MDSFYKHAGMTCVVCCLFILSALKFDSGAKTPASRRAAVQMLRVFVTVCKMRSQSRSIVG
jgi:hypothetical protein